MKKIGKKFEKIRKSSKFIRKIEQKNFKFVQKKNLGKGQESPA